MKYFVTGATGFVGSWVVEKLVEQEQEVICLVRKTSNLQWILHLPLQLHYGSLNDPESYKDALKNSDYVVHVAGVTKALHKKEYYLGNVIATQNLIQTVRNENPGIEKFVHISSQAAVGPAPDAHPVDETFPCRPLTDYGISKLQSEEIVKNYMTDLPVTILRPGVVYGPRDTDVLEAFRNIKRGINLKIGKYDQLISLIHVQDLAEGIISSAQHSGSTGETFFIANQQAYLWSDLIANIKKLMNRRALDLSVPYSVAYLVAAFIELFAYIQKKPTILNRQKMMEIREKYWTVSTDKIQRKTGFCPKIDINEGLQSTLQWYEEHGWL